MAGHAARLLTLAIDRDVADRQFTRVQRQLGHPVLLHLHRVLQGGG